MQSHGLIVLMISSETFALKTSTNRHASHLVTKYKDRIDSAVYAQTPYNFELCNHLHELRKEPVNLIKAVIYCLLSTMTSMP